MTRPGLTAKQQDAFDAILAHQAEHGLTPTIAELAAALGVSSKSTAVRLILALEERGYIVRMPFRARSIAVIDADALPKRGMTVELRAKLLAYCRSRGEKPADVIADAVALFLDAEDGAVAA